MLEMFVCGDCGEGFDRAGHCPFDGGELTSNLSMPLLGTSIGPYRLARPLGGGATGTVYLAVQPELGSRVAIKILTRAASESAEMCARFLNEAKAANLIRHENIVKVLDLTSAGDGRPASIMEYIEGEPLGEHLSERGPLGPGELAAIFGDQLSALGAAHKHGVIHRDLKPSNIWVTRLGRAIILDFGVAKLYHFGSAGPVTATGALMGSVHYLSPELARGEPAGASTDIYSVGVMLYEAATGSRPFEGRTSYEILRHHVASLPKPPRDLRPEIGEDLEAVILRAISKRAEERFASAGEMHTALRAACGLRPKERAKPIRENATAANSEHLREIRMPRDELDKKH